MIFGAKGSNEATIIVGEACVRESKEENLFGISLTSGQSFAFQQHVKTPCKKISQRLHDLARRSRYMDTDELQNIFKIFMFLYLYNIKRKIFLIDMLFACHECE